MDKNKKQTNRYTDTELSLIRNTFAGKDELLRVIRKFMLQLPMTKSDKELLESIKGNKEVLAVIRKAFLPELDGEAPLNQVVDLWMTIDTKDKDVTHIEQLIESRRILIEFLEQQLSALEGVKPAKILKLNDLLDGTYINLIARNTAIGHTEMQLQMFSILAEQKDEDSVRKIQNMNSSK